MAKKSVKNQEVKVLCVDCIFCPGEVVNYLVECNNEKANPGGYKKGCWEHVCRYFVSKK